MVILLILFLYLGLYITYPFIILFHEMGHALAYLTISNPKKVEVFIGNMGDRTTKMKFRVGKLHFYVKQSLLLTGGGACASDSREANYINEIVILLAGSVFSV